MRRALLSALTATLFLVLAGCGDDDGGSGGGGTKTPLPLIVKTASGEIEGALSEETRVFLGIPYAEPPVGPLRFKPPAPHAPWAERFQAFTKGRFCAQPTPVDGTYAEASGEDCLTLNVWAPAFSDASDPPSGRPVMVWIHGGGFKVGSGGDSAYDGRALSEATGTVVVTINYRLGVFGFLGLPELKAEDPQYPSSGNYGIDDQRAAFRWVKENAPAFGGDPERITIFGESAGGASVCQHLVSPKSAGLFSRAIIESGPCDLVMNEPAAFTRGGELLTALGCSGAGALGCLRGKSTAELIVALTDGGFGVPNGEPNWYPVVDGNALPDRPSALLASGQVQRVPTILGTNSEEASLFFILGDTTIADDPAFLAFVEDLVPGRGADIVAQYPPSEYGSAQDAAIAAVGDAGFVCPTRRAARGLAAAGAPTFLYHFEYAPTSLFGDIGAYHSSEIKYVLGNPGQLTPLPLTDEELALSHSIMGYWQSPEAPPAYAAAPFAWPPYRAETDEHLVLDLTISKGSALRRAQCDFWDGVPLPE
ncbi:MAG: carboxylesterase family protein [Polyangiaceae bacterium]|nr:carboxylesterase family protein [Polyangiaceae bacterium]